MKRYIATIFNHRQTSLQKVNILFAEGELVTLDSVQSKVQDKLRPATFMLIAWSPVDEFTF